MLSNTIKLQRVVGLLESKKMNPNDNLFLNVNGILKKGDIGRVAEECSDVIWRDF